MTLKFSDVPVSDQRHSLQRTRPPRPGRRAILKGSLGAATAAAFGVLTTVNSTVARAGYFDDYTSTTAGPCNPTTGYARRHTENGLKCGPSQMCSACCWTTANSGANKQGWHRTGASGATEYSHRPDQCWAGTYDSWRWKFSDGNTYRCSDGYRFNSSGSTRTICPYSV